MKRWEFFFSSRFVYLPWITSFCSLSEAKAGGMETDIGVFLDRGREGESGKARRRDEMIMVIVVEVVVVLGGLDQIRM